MGSAPYPKPRLDHPLALPGPSFCRRDRLGHFAWGGGGSLSLPQSTEPFQTRWQDPSLPLGWFHNPEPRSSSQVSPPPRTKSSPTGHQSRAEDQSGCAHGDPPLPPHPDSSEQLPSAELARARLWLLLSGCCTGDVAQSFLPGGRETFFNIGNQSSWLAVHMRRGQGGPAHRPRGMAASLPFISPSQRWDFHGQGHGDDVK